jgi:hypothetical protein
MEIDSSQPRGWYSRGYLPHFDGGAVPQFITIRLADRENTGLHRKKPGQSQIMRKPERLALLKLALQAGRLRSQLTRS